MDKAKESMDNIDQAEVLRVRGQWMEECEVMYVKVLPEVVG